MTIDDIELTYFDCNTGTEITVNNARLSTIEGDSWTAFAGERKRSGIENSISMRSLPIDIQDFTIKVRMRVADDNYIFDYQVNRNYIEKSKRYPVSKTSGGFSEIIFEKQKVYTKALFVDDKGDKIASKNVNDLSFLKINVEQEDMFLALSSENSNKIGYQQRNFVHDLDFYNLFSENGAAKVAVNRNLVDNPSQLNVGKLSKNALGSGNAELLMQISEISHQQTLFPAAGALPKITNTFGGYVVEMIEYTSFRFFEANANDDRESRFRDLLNSDFNSISGVNSEEELQKSVIIQNAYNSLAHIISVVQELFKIFIQSI